MTDSEDFKSGFNLGEIQSDIRAIKESLGRVESSMTRSGERMGKMEDGLSAVKLDMAAHKERDDSISKDVEKLERSKSWFITAIIGAFLAQITQWVMGRKI